MVHGAGVTFEQAGSVQLQLKQYTARHMALPSKAGRPSAAIQLSAAIQPSKHDHIKAYCHARLLRAACSQTYMTGMPDNSLIVAATAMVHNGAGTQH